ncbi:hypothetical protein [Mammaliicoccus sp. Dog046]|uniref:alpha/beta hydrolase n=1 Tax=Mammaliicoccus sp. Dog046 TaxID=3034233 RepID=UPI002B260787|nr:hypothetical protein [Mammaliicoccus sp. Dog046]WQK85392.1 hypothetical protein P3U32_12415 [Mammaliicoccus sp. Dog046]
MHYFFQENPNSHSLIVLFHGTGGNQYQLLPFSGELFPDANVLSLQGNVGDGKDRRFFAPLVNQQLNREDFNEQTQSFITFWDTFIEAHDFEQVIFLGYSNGANFILGLLEQELNHVDRILLLHPSNLDYHFNKHHDHTDIIITSGANDHLSIPGKVKTLSEQLNPYFKNVRFELLDGGHELNEDEVKKLKTILTAQ